MRTIGDITYLFIHLLEQRGFISKDHSLSPRLIYYYLQMGKNFLIQQKKKSLSNYREQTICIRMSPTDIGDLCPCIPKLGCLWMSSDCNIPTPIRGTKLKYHSPTLRSLTEIGWDTAKLRIDHPIDPKTTYISTINTSGGLKVYQHVNASELLTPKLRVIYVTGYFEDLESYESCCDDEEQIDEENSEACISMLDKEWALDSDLDAVLFDIVLERWGNLWNSLRPDIIPNDRDDTGSSGLNINPKNGR